MDPNANLSEQLDLAAELLTQHEHTQEKLSEYDTARLCELVLTLNNWISSGGFLPDRWELARKRAAV